MSLDITFTSQPAHFQGNPEVKNLIANALLCGDHVVVNADW